MLCLFSKRCCCHDVASNKVKFTTKGHNKRVLGQGSDGPVDKYRQVLDEKVNFMSTNRGFRLNNHSVATYEQVKKPLLLIEKSCREGWPPRSISYFEKKTSFPHVLCLFKF